MTFEQLKRATNTNNSIEYNITSFIGSFKNKDEAAYQIGRVILNAMDSQYKTQDYVIGMMRTIANQNADSFGGVATYAFYLFTMDYCNDMLKQKPNDNSTYSLIKSIEKEVIIGKKSLDDYLCHRITKGPYVQQLFKTKNVMGISDQYHDTLHDFITVQKNDIVKFMIDVYAARI